MINGDVLDWWVVMKGQLNTIHQVIDSRWTQLQLIKRFDGEVGTAAFLDAGSASASHQQTMLKHADQVSAR